VLQCCTHNIATPLTIIFKQFVALQGHTENSL